jgi:hypothetical protein
MPLWGHLNEAFPLLDSLCGLGGSDTVRPLPEQLNASNFHLIQPAPQHLWVTILGHRVMRAQWGYGCDLYLRNNPPTGASSP